MASGLAALLDDIAGIAKLAAASLDDVTAAASKAGVKAAGVVVDDTAVTPRYSIGFTPDRELPIVFKIALGSLRNKFLFLLPGALLLSWAAPWAVTPILMAGGAYLCFEASEKTLESFGHHHEDEDETQDLALSSHELERQKVAGAIRTDLILSAEIMAISLASVATRPLLIQAAALAVVGLALTAGVYGAVALIVKLDDIGLHLAQRSSPVLRTLGRGMVKAMPIVLNSLGGIGTAAMLWVGGGILVHGLEKFHVGGPVALLEHAAAAAQTVPAVGAVLAWLVTAAASAVVGLIVGGALALGLKLVRRRRR